MHGQKNIKLSRGQFNWNKSEKVRILFVFLTYIKRENYHL